MKKTILKLQRSTKGMYLIEDVLMLAISASVIVGGVTLYNNVVEQSSPKFSEEINSNVYENETSQSINKFHQD